MLSWYVDPSHRPATARSNSLWRLLAELMAFQVKSFGIQEIGFKIGSRPIMDYSQSGQPNPFDPYYFVDLL